MNHPHLFKLIFQAPQDHETTSIYLVSETWEDAIAYAHSHLPKPLASLVQMERANDPDERVWIDDSAAQKDPK